MGSQMRLSCYTSISISRGVSEPSVVGNPQGVRQTR
jgi:hypothetical protein